jgi:hypothetical protein
VWMAALCIPGSGYFGEMRCLLQKCARIIGVAVHYIGTYRGMAKALTTTPFLEPAEPRHRKK